MADIRIRFGSTMGSGSPVYGARPKQTAKITSSGTSQATTVSAEAGDYVTVRAIGGAVAVDIAASPTAIATGGDVVMSGETVDYGPLNSGDKVAVIDVA